MTDTFTYHSDPVRVVLGPGAAKALRAEADRHKFSRIVVLCSKTRTEFTKAVVAPIAERIVGFCDTGGQTMPREAFEHILAELKRLDADGFIVVGGGSPIGLAKAAGAMTKLPYIAVVTTYSGSEMAARWYIGVAENRISGDGPAALPATAIYDPELTLDLPARVSAASGMNAMAHAVETLYGADTNPIVQTLAEEGIRLLGSGLPAPGRCSARSQGAHRRAIRRLARGEFPRRSRARARHRATSPPMVQSRTCADPRHRHALRHRLQRQFSAGGDDAHQARARRE